MYSVEIDPSKRLLIITAQGHVAGPEVDRVRSEVAELIDDAAPGFVVLVDFRFVESMRPETAQPIGEIMDLFAKKQVGSVVRVIPHPSKDVGMNILSQLHYGSRVEVATVKSMAEAIVILADVE